MAPVKLIDEYATEGSDIKYNDLALSVCYSSPVYFNTSVGIGLKYIRQELHTYVSSSFAFDFGLMSNYFYKDLFLGFVIKNIGTKTKFKEEPQDLPLSIKIGSSYIIDAIENFKITPAIDFDILNTKLNLGSEFIYDFKKILNFSFRVGYILFNNFALGLGIKYSNFIIDYAFLPLKMGLIHQISLSIKY